MLSRRTLPNRINARRLSPQRSRRSAKWTSASSAREVDGTFDGELLVLEDDVAIRGEPSVIVDLTSREPVVLRDGNIYNAVFMRVDHER